MDVISQSETKNYVDKQLADVQYKNLVSTNKLLGLYPNVAYSTIDNGSNETVCAKSAAGRYLFQIYKMTVEQGHKYLFTCKVKGTTVTNTNFSLVTRYGWTTSLITPNSIPTGYSDVKKATGAFDYTRLAYICTVNNSSYSTADFTIGIDQINLDTVWAYKEVMIVDITGYTDAQIQSLLTYGYFQINAVKSIIAFNETKNYVNDQMTNMQYENIVGTDKLLGLYPNVDWPTTDNGASETVCALNTEGRYLFQRYQITVEQGHKYLFTAKIKGTTVTNTSFNLTARYGYSTTLIEPYATPAGCSSVRSATGTFEYERLAYLCTANNSAYSTADFTIGIDQINLDTVWAYKEVMVVDVTNYTDAQIQTLLTCGYFQYNTLKSMSNTIWGGKNVLAIGDSLTAAYAWQTTVATMHNCTITTHALGGIGFVAMVDGASGGNGTLAPLTATDVANKDLIILFGGMNERSTPYGELGDVYPTNNTLYGKLQYVINKIYGFLADVENLTCKILVVAPHCCGKNGYLDANGYDVFPAGSGQTLELLCNHIKTCAQYNNCQVVDLWHDSGIGKNTWVVYAASSTPTLTTPNTGVPYPNNADQLHLNSVGYARIGTVIAEKMNLV